jgi:hypothetical protein
MFKPVMPVVMDVLAHTFWEQQHMLVVHEVNGQFHVHNELISVSHPSEKDKESAAAKFQVEECIPVTAVFYYQCLHNALQKQAYRLHTCVYPSSFPEIDAPPPKLQA